MILRIFRKRRAATPTQSTPTPPQQPKPRSHSRAVYLLLPIAVIAGVLSWENLYEGAKAAGIPENYAAAYPALLDTAAVLTAAVWVWNARRGFRAGGWRVLTYGLIATTVVMNALAAGSLDEVPWHVVPPAMIAVLIELVAHDLAQVRRREVQPEVEPERISVLQQLLHPVTAIRVRLLMGATRQTDAAAARAYVTRARLARHLLASRLRGLKCLRARLELASQLASGTLSPTAVVAVLDDSAGLGREELRDRLYRLTAAGAAHESGPVAALVTGPEAAHESGPVAALVTGPEAAPVTGPEPAHESGPEAARESGPQSGPTTALVVDIKHRPSPERKRGVKAAMTAEALAALRRGEVVNGTALAKKYDANERTGRKAVKAALEQFEAETDEAAHQGGPAETGPQGRLDGDPETAHEGRDLEEGAA